MTPVCGSRGYCDLCPESSMRTVRTHRNGHPARSTLTVPCTTSSWTNGADESHSNLGAHVSTQRPRLAASLPRVVYLNTGTFSSGGGDFHPSGMDRPTKALGTSR